MNVEPTAELESWRQAFLAERVDTWFYGRVNARSRHSLHIRILDELTQDIARLANADQRSDQAIMQQLWFDAELLFSQLQSLGRGDDPDCYLNFWQHIDRLPDPTGGPFLPLRSDDIRILDEVATDYLRQPARSPLLSRTLADALMALEIFILANAVNWLPTVRGLTPHRLDAPRPLIPFLKTLAISLVWALATGGVLFLLIKAAFDANVVPQEHAGIAVLIILGVPMLIGALGLRAAQSKADTETARVRRLLSLMFAAYTALEYSSDRSEVRSAIRAATDAGAVWPPLLHPLLFGKTPSARGVQ